MDMYFTSVPLARWATEHKISIVGTMRLDRKGIPKEFKSTDNSEEKSTTFINGQDTGDENMTVSSVTRRSQE